MASIAVSIKRWSRAVKKSRSRLTPPETAPNMPGPAVLRAPMDEPSSHSAGFLSRADAAADRHRSNRASGGRDLFVSNLHGRRSSARHDAYRGEGPIDELDDSRIIGDSSQAACLV